MDENTDAIPSPLSLRTLPHAKQDIENAVEWLSSFSEETAERFVIRLEETLDSLRSSLAIEIAVGGRPGILPNEGASLHFSRPIYQHRFQTGKTPRRRSGAGQWNLYFSLADDDGNGTPEVLVLYAVRHATASPFPVWEEHDEKDE